MTCVGARLALGADRAPPTTVAELRVERIESWDQHPGLLPAWNEMTASAGNIFLTREWLTSWWSAFGGPRELVLLLCFDRARELIGIVPLYRTRAQGDLGLPLDVLRLVGDGTFDSDHLDFIVRPGYDAEVARAVLDWLTAQREKWDVMELSPVRSESPTMNAVRGELTARGWSQAIHEDEHSVIELPDTWDEYLASLSAGMRTNLRRKSRDLHKRHDVSVRTCDNEAQLPLFLDQLYRMHTERWNQRGLAGSFEYPGRQAFYDTIARRFLALGWLSFSILDVGGVPAAAEFGFRNGPTHSFLQSGFSKAHAHQSVGVMLKCHILQSLIAAGVKQYDFLGGSEAYKLRWGSTLARHSRLRCARQLSTGAAFLEVRNLAARTKAWLHRSIPASISAPLRVGYRRLWPYRDDIKEARVQCA